MLKTCNASLLAFFLGIVGTVPAGEQASDPCLGDWEGEGMVAQVIPRGDGNYQINLLGEFDVRREPLAVLTARADDGGLHFDQNGWKGQTRQDRLIVLQRADDKSGPVEMVNVIRQSPRVGASAPRGAFVLFDGSGFGQWEVHGKAGPATQVVWEHVDDFMRVAPMDPETRAGHSLVTKRAFKDFRLHLEFRLPLMADKSGQARANGGVTFEDANWYELQILDSYGLEGLDNECGGIYKVAAPAVNMCRPPLMWQTYDVDYHAPRYDEAGNRIQPGRISVNHNGKQIHNNVELPDSEKAEQRRKADPKSVTAGRIILHYHKDPVEYRNIWLEEL